MTPRSTRWYNGVSDREPLDPHEPRSPRNRRVSIVLLHGGETLKPDDLRSPAAIPASGKEPARPAPLVPTAQGETLTTAPPPRQVSLQPLPRVRAQVDEL